MSFSQVRAFYVILWNFTEQGIKNLKDCIQSIEILKTYTERRGNLYHGTYYSFGQYDAVSLVEADNDNEVRYDLLQAERQGNLRSTTLKSITHEEAIKLAESI
jgi:uncharacterized protein with GYD domain